MKKFIKENIIQILFLILFAIVINYEVPYYIEAPGGVINVSERLNKNYDKKNGSLNMLYVTEYKGNIATFLLGKIIKSWDVYEISNQQVSNESTDDIYLRNRVMLENSIQNAIFAAYKEAGKEINIKGQDNIVLATTKDNSFKIGDKIISIDDKKIEDVNTIKEILSSKKVNDVIDILVLRNDRNVHVKFTIPEDKTIGVMVITNYIYDLGDDLPINFKSSEGGSSGGFILSLGIYSKITGVDILRGRKVAGTGTIGMDGSIGEIDGIKYKIAGAVKNKVDVVLVSPYNYDEALKVVKENNYKINIVKVETLKDAIEYLTK